MRLGLGLGRLLGEVRFRASRAHGHRIASVRSSTLVRRVSRPFGGGRRVLRLANAYATLRDVPEVVLFATGVAEGSAGLIDVRFVNAWTRATDRREESTVIRDVMRGTVDLGWAGTRVFGALGVRSLDPLQAPFLFADYAAQAAVFSGDLVEEMLAGLEPLGVVGLVVAPGAFRKPLGFSRPLVGAADYEGAVIRTHESNIGEATFRALGATPVMLSAAEMAATARERVDGMDIHVSAIGGWNYRGYLTANVNLWPRMTVIVANRRTFDRLGADERQLLRDCAARAGGRAVRALSSQEERDRRARPADASIVQASPDQLSELRERVEPVYAELRRHSETTRFLDAVEALASSTRRA